MVFLVILFFMKNRFDEEEDNDPDSSSVFDVLFYQLHAFKLVPHVSSYILAPMIMTRELVWTWWGWRRNRFYQVMEDAGASEVTPGRPWIFFALFLPSRPHASRETMGRIYCLPRAQYAPTMCARAHSVRPSHWTDGITALLCAAPVNLAFLAG